MNKKIVLLAAAAAIAAVPAMANIRTFANNGTKFALPASWNTTGGAANSGYGVRAATFNNGSSMCVECHSVNPSEHITTPTANATGKGATVAWLRTQKGTHFVMNMIGLTGTPSTPIGSTDTGGGFAGGFGTQPRNGGEYEKLDAWATTRLSKYQPKGNANLTSTTGAVGDMICESCHNIVNNPGPNLLLDAYTDNNTSTLCLGCHSATSPNSLHDNGNLPSFNSANRKRHHVTTTDAVNASFATAVYGGSDASLMWAPTFSSQVAPEWCATPYGAGTPVSIASAAISFRNQCNISGQGAKSTGNVTGDIVPVNATTLTCANCHRPHNATDAGGAFILRIGGDPASTTWAGVQGTSAAAAGTTGYGIRRQKDVGNWSSVGAKIYGEYVPLCKGCHQGYGN